MKRLVAILGALVLISALSGGAQAASDNLSAKFDWHVSDAFVQSAGEPPQTGAVARSSAAGHRIRVSGAGTFNAAAKTVSGGGTHVHTDASGQVISFGTWTATGLDSFTSFGCGGTFPANFCGGLAVIRVHISSTSTIETLGHVELDGILTVDCLIGAPPPSAQEGIKLNIPGVINFDTTEPSHHGETLFITRSHSGG